MVDVSTGTENKVPPDNSTVDTAQTVTPASLAIDVDSARVKTPNSRSGISATTMPPVAAAGFTLAKSVLLISALSIAALIIFLFVIEIKNDSNQRAANDQLLILASIGSNPADPARVEKLSGFFQKRMSGEPVVLTEDSLKDGRDLIRSLDNNRSVSERQRPILDQCLSLSELTAASGALLKECIDILDMVKRNAANNSFSLEKLRILSDFSKQTNDHRQAFHAFWIQAAQLILLNLLLPLLTGLFGYIFGTQKEKTDPKSE